MILVILAAALLLPATLPANPLERDAEILIHSEPSGAAVMALGKTWGVTPLRLRVRDAFPALYRPEQPYIGMAVHLSKPGCAEYRVPIHRRSIPDEIHAELDCDPAVLVDSNGKTSPPAPAAEPAPADTPPANPLGVRAKLQQLEQLRQDGLVSEEEYQRLRRKVLEYF
ncbi:MAG: SHOCT domain-containing protein [Gammaproteobacteria bacterium]|nr:SHOCT domain-containing protein [Gammaproteobacteria bacterium]